MKPEIKKADGDIKMGTIKDDTWLVDLDNKQDVEKLAEHFMIQNDDIFKMLACRLSQWASQGNSLYINWLLQSVMGLIKDANSSCKQKLGVSPEKMQ